MFRINLEQGSAEKISALVEQALPVFEAAGEDLALYIAYYALAEVAQGHAQMAACLDAAERAFAHAARAGYAPPGLFAWRASCRYFGTTPVSDLLAWIDENDPRARRDHFLRAYQAGALAMLGRFDEARAILAEARAELAGRGGGVLLANITSFESVDVERWAGDPAAAAEFGVEGLRLHEEIGDQYFVPAAAGDLAQALYAVDRLDDADAMAARAAELGGSDDAMKEMIWRQVRAKVLARRGQHADAERLGREAIAIAEGTDFLNGQGDANADLAAVLSLAGRAEEAAEALEQALERYERKGNIVMAARMRDRLAVLREEATR
jgi:tetratricopeptide (TPR) repeat protein